MGWLLLLAYAFGAFVAFCACEEYPSALGVAVITTVIAVGYGLYALGKHNAANGA